MIRYVLCVLLSVSSAFGGLDWQNEKVELKVHPTQTGTEAVYRFRNAGGNRISISSVLSNCGCINAKPTKPYYDAGAEGELVLMVDLRNRAGELRKLVKVKTSDGKVSTLTVVVDIPRAYAIDTPLIRWNKGDQAKEKTVRLTNPNTTPIRLLSITSSHDAMPAELIAIREGFEYDVRIHRKASGPNLRSVIRIVTEPPPGERKSKMIRLYAIAP